MAILGSLAACSTMGGGTGPSNSPPPPESTAPAPGAETGAAPSVSPVIVPSTGPSPSTPLTVEAALAAVIAEFPRFEGYPLRTSRQADGSPEPIVGRGLVGQSRWVVARQVPAGIELTFVTGSGDCPAGCIDYAYDTYLVEPDGRVSFICSEGEPAGGARGTDPPAVGLPFEPCAGVPR